jgi:endonuclease YncB( thermonuclease family)
MLKNKKFIKYVLTLFIFFILSFSSFASYTLEPGTVTYISDGDTIRFQRSKTKDEALRIRMVGIDTPELHFPVKKDCDFSREKCYMVGQGHWGLDAKRQLQKIAPVQTQGVLQNQGIDKYGRTLGKLFIGNFDVNLAMVQSGWAYPYIICSGPSCNKNYFKTNNVAAYLKACHTARQKGLGVWNPNDFLKETPWAFRMRIRNEAPTKWVGDFTTKKVYPPQYYKKVDVCNSVFFLTKQDALNAGFSE